MADLLTFFPVFQEDVVSVRARIDADANAGVAVDDPLWIDTREGTFYWDVTQPVVIEMARLWDAISVEVPAAAFPLFAWGQYLDEHAAVFGLARKEAIAATGHVTFIGDAGTLVATGTIVSADPATEDGDAIEFSTTESGTIPDGILAPGAVAVTPNTAGGTMASGTYYYTVTAYNALGETEVSDEVDAVVVGPTGSVFLDWPDVTGAVGYRVYRSPVAGGTGQRVHEGAASNFTDTGVALGAQIAPDANATAGIVLAVEAVEAGQDGNLSALAITNLDTPNVGVDSVYNANPITSGEEVETDEALRTRILFEFEGQGGGSENDYRRWALSIAGVGRVFVNPVWLGPGTVQVVVMQEDGDAVSPEIVDAVQQYLDPIPGLGRGVAPVGAEVTVQTPAVVNIAVAGTVTFATGYSLDGGGGTIATRAQIEQALSDYVDNLDVGEDVIYEHVKAQLFRVEGVYNVSGVTVNGGTADVALTSDPAQVAQLTTPVSLA